jgi:hypothetical protein
VSVCGLGGAGAGGYGGGGSYRRGRCLRARRILRRQLFPAGRGSLHFPAPVPPLCNIHFPTNGTCCAVVALCRPFCNIHSPFWPTRCYEVAGPGGAAGADPPGHGPGRPSRRRARRRAEGAGRRSAVLGSVLRDPLRPTPGGGPATSSCGGEDPGPHLRPFCVPPRVSIYQGVTRRRGRPQLA